MTSPLQDKDRHWRRRPNGAAPVTDPGLALPGTDAEAGDPEGSAPAAGRARAPAPASPHEGADLAPLPRPSGPTGPGLRLPPRFWYGLLGLLVLVLALLAVVSL